MTELEKMNAGLEYDYSDPEVNGVKLHAVQGCSKLEAIPVTDNTAREQAIRELFGSAGINPKVYPGFHCDLGYNIHVGDDFLANYNVTILDRAPVNIGNHVMIGPNCVISAVGHPLSPNGRRNHLSFAKPITIGDDVWFGGNCTVLPGINIGNNVVVAAGAVVTKDIPSNCVVAGIPARILKTLTNDTE